VHDSLTADRLLAIIRTQNEIAATRLDLPSVMALVAERARALTGAEAAVIELARGDEMVYEVGSGAAAAYVGTRLPIAASLSGRCVLEGRTLYCEDATADPRVSREACERVGAMSMLCVPLTHAGRVVGVLKVYDSRTHAFSAHDADTLDLLSGLIAAHMAHAADFEVRRHESRHDALTGLANRRAFDERLEAEMARARRHGGGLAVCLVDLDRFKAVNDTHGHAAGDAVLRAVAANLARVREEDAAFRLGGDEFGLLLIEPDADAGAALVADRISAAIEADAACGGVGASWGVAVFAPADDAASLLGRADAMLYANKRALKA
jgi:diguanylate cyclase (GGDEF)-like protein